MSSASSNPLNPVLQRLAMLQLAIAFVWLLFIGYLQLQGATNLQPAWALLALYLPLLVFTQAQLMRKAIQDWQLFLFLIIECQLFTGLLFFTGGATNPLISYFLVLLVIAAWGLPWSLSAWVAAICIIDYSLLAVWYQPILLSELNGSNHAGGWISLASWHLSGMWLTFVLSTLILVTLIPQLIRSRQQQQLEIQRLREQQLKNEQLIGIGTLAAGTAHEMGTPLMTMSMLLEDLLDSDLVGEQSPELEKDLDLLLQQVQRCQQSLQQLAKQGREARTAKVQPASQWLHDNLQRWQLSHPQAQYTGHFPDEDCSLIETSPLLDQALLNLLDNSAEAGNQPVQLQQQQLDNFWVLDIIQPDPNAARSLEQYVPYQSNKQSGLGIGLYLSNASVEQFGGQIELQALENGGSCCRLRLPLQPATSSPTSGDK